MSYTTTKIKRNLIEKRGHKCESCGRKTWMKKDIPLELDHINGDPYNHDESNLKLLCPNCHTLTPTYKGRNKTIKITDDEIKNMIPNAYSASDCLRKLKKRPQKYTIDRVNKVKEINNLCFLNREYKSSAMRLKACKECEQATFDSKSGLCRKCYCASRQKVQRPNYKTLIKEIKELGYSATGRIYKVSDNTIRKWIKRYEEEMK